MNLNVGSLTLLSLNESLKYSLGVATAAAGDPVVLIMSLLRVSQIWVVSLYSHSDLTSQSSSFPTSSRCFKGLRSSLFGILFFKITGFSFCPGSSSRYICCDPRSQVSGGGIIKTQSQLLHEMILHGSLETNNTVKWISKRLYCLFGLKSASQDEFFLFPKTYLFMCSFRPKHLMLWFLNNIH